MKRVLNILFNPIVLLLIFVCTNTLLSGQSLSNPIDIILAFIESLIGFVPMILIFGLIEEKRLSKILTRRFYKTKNGTVYHRDKNCRCIKNRDIEECDSEFIENKKSCEVCCRLKWWERYLVISFLASLLYTILWFLYDKFAFPILEELYNNSSSTFIAYCSDLFSSSGVSQYFKGETLGYFVSAVLANFLEFFLFSLILDIIILITMLCLKLSNSDPKLHGVCLTNRITYILKTNSWIHNLAMFLIIPEIFILLSLPLKYEHLGDKAQTIGLNKTAFQLYKFSFVMADYDSLYKIAECELHGIGTNQNSIQGMEHMRNAADNDSIKANLKCGKMLFYNDSSSEQDKKDAIEYLMFAADNDEHEAQYILYLAHKYGSAPQLSRSDAKSFLKSAAQSGMMEAQFEYALIAESPDEKEKWLRLAAKNGHKGAAIMLKEYLIEGNGTDFFEESPETVTPPSPASKIGAVSSGSEDGDNGLENRSSAGELIEPKADSASPTDDVQASINANNMRSTLSGLQSELDGIETDSIKPTDDIKTIYKAKNELYGVLNRLNELLTTVRKSDIAQDEKESLINEIAGQRKQGESKQAELAKIQSAHVKHRKLSKLQTELDEIKTDSIKPTDGTTLHDTESKLNEVLNRLDELRTTVKNLDIVEDERESLINEILKQIKLAESKQAELAKVKNANELRTKLSEFQSELNGIETDSIKPTDDTQTINDVESKLNTLSNNLNELMTIAENADIVQDERDSLTTEIAKQKELVDSKQAELAKVKNANELRTKLSNLQSKLDEIEAESIKPTDDIKINSADAELTGISEAVKALKDKINAADVNTIDVAEKITLEENCKELSSKLQSKMNTIELCKQWNRIAEINTRIDKISGWNLKKDDKKELDSLKDELAKIDGSILDISDGERKSLEEKNKMTFQKMVSETNDKITKIYRKHTFIKLLYTGIIVAIVTVLWKWIRRRRENHESGETNPL